MRERWWLPEGEPRAAVVLVHGLKDHGARYDHAGGWLADRGYAVYALDLRGHGESGGERFFVETFDEYVEDLAVFLGRVREKEFGRPVFLMGHSMGGAVASLFVMNRRPELRGLVLTAPALEPNESVSPILIRLSGFISRFFPRAPVTKVDVKSLSHLPAVVEAARKDPLSNERPAPARTGYEILRAMRRIRERAAEVSSPLLVMHGSEDRLTNPRGSETFFKRAGSEDKTIKLYEGLYHEILNEPERADPGRHRRMAGRQVSGFLASSVPKHWTAAECPGENIPGPAGWAQGTMASTARSSPAALPNGATLARQRFTTQTPGIPVWA